MTEDFLEVKVYYLNDEEKMKEFRNNHSRLGELTREEYIEMILIYHQLHQASMGLIDDLNKLNDDLFEKINYSNKLLNEVREEIIDRKDILDDLIEEVKNKKWWQFWK